MLSLHTAAHTFKQQAKQTSKKMASFQKNDDKRNGAILGHALGDALGAPVEFYPYAHYTGVLDAPIVRYTRAYGKQVSSVGQITDDAEMALVLMDTLNSGYTKEKAVVNYMLWANNNYDGCKGNMPFMGKNTRNLFIAPKPTYKLYNNRFNKHYPDEITKENSQSNGALMRAYPLAFIDDPDIIRTDVEITNPSEFVQAAVFAYITAIKMALNGNSKEEIKHAVKTIQMDEPLSVAFEQACSGEFRDVTHSRGHIVHAFYCAFWGLFQFHDYKSAIDAIISLSPEEGIPAKICLPGKWKKKEVRVGDTDTNAAIAGALLGAFYGLEAIRSDPVTNTNIQVLLECDSRKGDIVRPKKYSMASIDLE
jgi:ADP-ribosylglycohydrolase